MPRAPLVPPDPVPPDPVPPTAVVLTAPELLALQLLARGYTLRQVALLTGGTDLAVAHVLASAVWVLEAADVMEAIATARRRGFIL
jgi:DNA-binding NarL/FixJ family response regulator